MSTSHDWGFEPLSTNGVRRSEERAKMGTPKADRAAMPQHGTNPLREAIFKAANSSSSAVFLCPQSSARFQRASKALY
jgi:hypothetical protein